MGKTAGLRETSSDVDLQTAYAQAFGEAHEHPEEALWERYAFDALTAAEKDGLSAHVAICAECATVVRALTELEAGARAFDPSTRQVAERPRRRLFAYWGLAAAATASFLIPAWLTRVAPTVPPIDQPPSSPAALRSSSLLEAIPVAPQGSLDSMPREFRFRPAPGARSHFVRLYDSGGTLVWSSASVTGDSVTMPQEIRTSPGRYYWQVLAQPEWSGDVKDQIVSTQVAFEVVR